MTSHTLRLCCPRAVSLAALLLLSSRALGQDSGLGLDLTQPTDATAPTTEKKNGPDDTPGSTPLGLDLSDPNDLRPSLAVIGIAPPWPRDSALAARMAAAVESAARSSGSFSSVLISQQSRARLAQGYADALTCAAAECLERLAQQLGVERVLVGQISYGNQQTLLKLEGLVRGGASAVTIEMTPANTGRAVQANALAAGTSVLKQLGDRQSKIRIKTNVDAATVLLGERELGTGSTEARVSPGQYTVRVVGGSGYQNFEREVTLKPNDTLEVIATLAEQQATKIKVADGIVDTDLPFVSHPKAALVPVTGTPWFKRPGLYLATAGLIGVGVGAGLGFIAQSTVSSAKTISSFDGGIVGVTRAQMLAAKNDAMLANILMAAGGALLVGGGIWFLATPSPPATPPTPTAGLASAHGGWAFAVGGTL